MRYLPAGLLALGCPTSPQDPGLAATEGGTMESDAAVDTAADESTGAPVVIDLDAIVAEAEAYQDYVQINEVPGPSEHELGTTVNVYVGPEIVDAYGSIDPDATRSDVVFPPGSYIFEEHLTGSEEFTGLTIMFKGPEGTNPAAGDWWWGRLTMGGDLADHGVVDFCIECHQAASGSDFVFGVPTDNRL